jgi:hypothetical protein
VLLEGKILINRDERVELLGSKVQQCSVLDLAPAYFDHSLNGIRRQYIPQTTRYGLVKQQAHPRRDEPWPLQAPRLRLALTRKGSRVVPLSIRMEACSPPYFVVVHRDDDPEEPTQLWHLPLTPPEVSHYRAVEVIGPTPKLGLPERPKRGRLERLVGR